MCRLLHFFFTDRRFENAIDVWLRTLVNQTQKLWPFWIIRMVCFRVGSTIIAIFVAFRSNRLLRAFFCVVRKQTNVFAESLPSLSVQKRERGSGECDLFNGHTRFTWLVAFKTCSQSCRLVEVVRPEPGKDDRFGKATVVLHVNKHCRVFVCACILSRSSFLITLNHKHC